MKYIRNLILGLMLTLGLTAAVMPAVAVYADPPKSTVCTAIGGCSSNANSGTTVQKVIKAVVNIFSAVVGFVAVIMIIMAGFKYISSGGDAQSIASAKNTLIYAIVGLIVVVAAKTIVYFVFQKVK